jgi:ubiquinone/menaquinone biosynthesis C-methylase UbiE
MNRQKIVLEKINAEVILDIGGGGEGIIGQLYGSKVISIDKLKNELDEVSNEAMKIIMDATDLKFLDNTFDLVTIFYSLMYLKSEEKCKAISEATRVLKPNGIIEIWDVNIDVNDLFITDLEVHLPNKIVTTSYGVYAENRKQSFSSVKKLFCKRVNIMSSAEYSKHFYVRGKKYI